MTLLETILKLIEDNTSCNNIDPHCFCPDDLAIVKSEDLSKIPAIHACPDDDFLWIDQDIDQNSDDMECYDLVTLPEEYNNINIYLYNLL